MRIKLSILIVFLKLTPIMADTNTTEIATFGAGCFWCVEAIFNQLKGVAKVESGYAGGETKNPTYEQICSGTTGHAEVIQITFNSEIISYNELLEVFFSAHNHTSINRQGNDIGTQYRSVIFYHNKNQELLSENYKNKLNKLNVWKEPVITEITPLNLFYKAEKYHQNYYSSNPNKSYCIYVIAPKINKLKKEFKSKLK